MKERNKKGGLGEDERQMRHDYGQTSAVSEQEVAEFIKSLIQIVCEKASITLIPFWDCILHCRAREEPRHFFVFSGTRQCYVGKVFFRKKELYRFFVFNSSFAR